MTNEQKIKDLEKRLRIAHLAHDSTTSKDFKEMLDNRIEGLNSEIEQLKQQTM